MNLTTAEIEAAAADLFEAERSGRQMELLSLRHPGMTMDGAYAIQRALIERKRADGRGVIGWKIGLTSRAMQQALGIDIPDSGVLLDDMLFEDGGTVPAGRFIQPRIEAEIAFIMKRDLPGPRVTADDVIAATEAIAPSLEILDTRILRADPQTGKARGIVDTIADNAANAGLVLGTQRAKPADSDMRWTGAIVSRDGVVEETGLGAGVLNDPALSVAWLANRLAEYGETIRAGQTILSGSFIRPVECPPGSHIEADFGAFGSVQVRFG